MRLVVDIMKRFWCKYTHCKLDLLTTLKQILLTSLKWSSLQKVILQQKQFYEIDPWSQTHKEIFKKNISTFLTKVSLKHLITIVKKLTHKKSKYIY